MESPMRREVPVGFGEGRRRIPKGCSPRLLHHRRGMPERVKNLFQILTRSSIKGGRYPETRSAQAGKACFWPRQFPAGTEGEKETLPSDFREGISSLCLKDSQRRIFSRRGRKSRGKWDLVLTSIDLYPSDRFLMRRFLKEDGKRQ